MILKTNNLDRETEKLERIFIKELETQYKRARNDIQAELGKAFAKYSVGDKLTYAEMAKYDRLQKLYDEIDDELEKLEKETRISYIEYGFIVYAFNQINFGNAINEVTNKTKKWDNLNKKIIKESILTPLDKIALKSNAENVRVNIQKAITQSLIKGEGIKKMSVRITDALEKNANNAVRIARTETTRVMNMARLDTIQKAETDSVKLMKRWVATNDERTRDSHASINGLAIPNDKPFPNGLMYPGDQTGDPAETINCRCSLATELVFL